MMPKLVPWPALLLLLSCLASCSDVPQARWPEHADFEVIASYELGASRSIVVPFSRDDVTLFQLHLDPAPLAERFVSAERTLVFGPAVETVELRCKGRHYGTKVADLKGLFPGAKRLIAQ